MTARANGKNGHQLTQSQERFCQEYLLDLNASAAYRRAYPEARGKTPEVNGCRLLGNAKVAERIAELQAKRAARLQITQDRVLEEFAKIGFSDMRDFATWGPSGISLTDSTTLTADQARCIAEVSETTSKDGGSLKFKLHDKAGALTKLGQHLGLFIERHELTGKDGGPIEMTPSQRVDRISAILAGAKARANGRHR